MTRDPGPESWVVDASPLILLGNIGQLVLLEALAPRINVPEAVLEEVAAGVDLDPQGGVKLAWTKVRTVPTPLHRPPAANLVGALAGVDRRLLSLPCRAAAGYTPRACRPMRLRWV